MPKQEIRAIDLPIVFIHENQLIKYGQVTSYIQNIFPSFKTVVLTLVVRLL